MDDAERRATLVAVAVEAGDTHWLRQLRAGKGAGVTTAMAMRGTGPPARVAAARRLRGPVPAA